MPRKKIVHHMSNFTSNLLHTIGYVKIKDFAIDLEFLEKIIYAIYKEKRNVFYFDFSMLYTFNISQRVLNDILLYLGFF